MACRRSGCGSRASLVHPGLEAPRPLDGRPTAVLPFTVTCVESPPVPRSSWWPPRGQAADGAVAGLLLVVAVAELLSSDHLEATPVALLATTAATVAIAWRRQAPLATVVVVFTAVVVSDFLDSPIEDLASSTVFLLLPVYSVAIYGRGWRPFAGLGVAVVGVAVSVYAASDFESGDDLLYAGPLVVGAGLAGGCCGSDFARLPCSRRMRPASSTSGSERLGRRRCRNAPASPVSCMTCWPTA
ncbi:MAG: DUF7134 domain-containing protein [Acidimicrobiales bacterium]